MTLSLTELLRRLDFMYDRAVKLAHSDGPDRIVTSLIVMCAEAAYHAGVKHKDLVSVFESTSGYHYDKYKRGLMDP